MTETPPEVPRRRAAFIFVFITILLDMLAIGIVIPVLPKLVLSFVEGDHVIAADVYGIFATVWALMQFVFSPVQGALSDHFGRRPVILVSNFGLGLDYDVRLPDLLNAVTMDDVNAAARSVLDPDRATVVIAGPYQ